MSAADEIAALRRKLAEVRGMHDEPPTQTSAQFEADRPTLHARLEEVRAMVPDAQTREAEGGVAG